jgi:hypothetical protein
MAGTILLFYSKQAWLDFNVTVNGYMASLRIKRNNNVKLRIKSYLSMQLLHCICPGILETFDPHAELF